MRYHKGILLVILPTPIERMSYESSSGHRIRILPATLLDNVGSWMLRKLPQLCEVVLRRFRNAKPQTKPEPKP